LFDQHLPKLQLGLHLSRQRPKHAELLRENLSPPNVEDAESS
jgi:hypothetical protein